MTRRARDGELYCADGRIAGACVILVRCVAGACVILVRCGVIDSYKSRVFWVDVLKSR